MDLSLGPQMEVTFPYITCTNNNKLNKILALQKKYVKIKKLIRFLFSRNGLEKNVMSPVNKKSFENGPSFRKFSSAERDEP